MEEKKTGEAQNIEKKEEKPKILKNAIEKYPFKVKKKMSNKEVCVFHW